MVKTILAVLIAAVPAGAAEFGLERSVAADLLEVPVVEASAPQREKTSSRLSVGEIQNRWIASIFVVGRNLGGIAASAQGVSPHAAPAGYAVSLSILADRTAAAAETMHYAHLDRRWHIVANEAARLDRVAADIREWAAQAQAHHNAAAIRARDLARAGEDLATALRWLRADAGLKAAPLPAVMPTLNWELDCASQDGARLSGRLSRKGGELRVVSSALYQQYGGQGETLRFLPEAGYPGDSLVFLSAGSAFFDLALELPASALTNPGAFAAELRVTFNDETQAGTALTCASK